MLYMESVNTRKWLKAVTFFISHFTTFTLEMSWTRSPKVFYCFLQGLFYFLQKQRTSLSPFPGESNRAWQLSCLRECLFFGIFSLGCGSYFHTSVLMLMCTKAHRSHSVSTIGIFWFKMVAQMISSEVLKFWPEIWPKSVGEKQLSRKEWGEMAVAANNIMSLT